MDDEFGGDDIDFSAAFEPERHNAPRSGPVAPSASNGSARVQQPKPQVLLNRQAPSAILVSTRQKGNPIIHHIRNLPWEYSDIPADFVLGQTTCALFLSLKYHRLHPEYIYSRIRNLAGKYNLRVLLTMVDITNHEESLKELSKTSLVNNLTLILCWSAQEAGRYLELYKSYEHAPSEKLRGVQATSYRESLTEFITTPRTINKTDATSLMSNFLTLQNAVNAQTEELALVPGWGEKKVQQWHGTVRENFRVRKAAKGGLGLRRDDSTRNAVTDEDDAGSRKGSLQTPISIESLPSREPSNLGPQSMHDSPSPDQNTRKRPAKEVQLWEPDEVDALLLAAAEEESEPAEIANNAKALASARKADEMSEGVMQALAKLREKG